MEPPQMATDVPSSPPLCPGRPVQLLVLLLLLTVTALEGEKQRVLESPPHPSYPETPYLLLPLLLALMIFF